MSSAWLEELKAQSPDLLVREQVMMKQLTTFRIGGPAEYLIEPRSVFELQLVRKIAQQ